jgi:hypothetical protein
MIAKMKVNQKSVIDFLVFAVGSVGLGIVIGTIASSAQKIQNGKLSPVSYQDFGIYTGAIVGISTFLVAIICYLALKRYILHRDWFSLKLYFLFCVITAAVISMVTSYWVVTSAPSFGMMARLGHGVITDSIFSAVIGGGIGLLFGFFLASIRHYED